MSNNPWSTPIGRRKLLALGGGALAAGALGGLGAGHAGAAGNRAARRAARRPGSGSLPKISSWYHGYGEEGVQDALERFAAEFPDAEVSVEWIPADYEATVSAALLTDEGPDVFEYGTGPTLDMIQAGQVVPLDGILGDAESDFNEALLNRVTFDGHLWAVPQIIDMFFLIYRKSWLEDAGIEPPSTLDELIAAAAALTNGDHSGLFLGNDGYGPTDGLTLWAGGGDFLTADNQVGFTTDGVYASFAKMQELYNSGSLLQGAPTDWSDPGAFISGLTAIQLTGLWTFPTILASDIGDDFDVLPWPALDASTGAPSLPFGAYSAVVSAKSAEAEAAKAFVKWLWVDQTDYQTEFATAFGFHLPARNSIADSAEVLQSGPALSAVKAYQQYGHPQNPILWTPASGEAYNAARARIITEGADPAEELAGVADIVNSELERVGGAASGSAPAGSEAMAGAAPATTG